MGILRKRIFDFVHARAILTKSLIILFFLIFPMLILYLAYPSSFLILWKGRGVYLLFLWLLCLELAVSYRKLAAISFERIRRFRLLAAVVFLVLPTMFALALLYTGLNLAIIELGRFLGVPFGGVSGTWILYIHWPLSFERALFALCFSVSLLGIYGKRGIAKLSVALFFLWAFVVFDVIDTFFPYGKIWVLQFFVPFTANSSAAILKWLGYKALTTTFVSPLYGPGTNLVVLAGRSMFAVTVFWASAGVHSLIIYSITILLLTRNVVASLVRKAVIFIVGAIGTFLVNLLRIVTICIIGLKVGSPAAQHFHDYYGELFFISWMIMYLAAILLGPKLLQKFNRTESNSDHDA